MTQVEQLARFINGLIKIIAVVFLFMLADAIFGPWGDTDTTDAPNKRSGMSLHMDYLTGCQYLGRGGALTPRLDKDGTQICMEVMPL